MKVKSIFALVLIVLFAVGFWSSGWLTGMASKYEAGSRKNPLASKSYLEDSVAKELLEMELEIKELSDRINTLQQELQR